jgi:diaminohydroxyphosphoribosylaminopyrimidine deaminase / 5-amino-6-(5-phosphoribosylamino)uracil reductase
MQQALALAEGSFGLTEPNPRVGCVIGHDDGRVFGTGATQHAGGPHAELMALREAGSQGHELAGATAWVTLEPCAHHGRTPPCCDALAKAGLARVVVGAVDPFPAVNGAGIERLRAAGVTVQMAPPALEAACRDINVGFFSRHERGRPWVRLKAAVSVDGRTALADGRSQWITGSAARADGHAWRRRASALLTGIGTVLADNPRLDVRLVQTPAQPMRIVLDPRWRTPAMARVLAPPGRTLIVGCSCPGDPAAGHRRDQLERSEAELLTLPSSEDGRVSLPALMQELARRGVNELHVEAGAVLNGALLEGLWVDEWLVYLAPRLLGNGRPLAEISAASALDPEPGWSWVECSAVGGDLRLRARRSIAASAPVGDAYNTLAQGVEQARSTDDNLNQIKGLAPSSSGSARKVLP